MAVSCIVFVGPLYGRLKLDHQLRPKKGKPYSEMPAALMFSLVCKSHLSSARVLCVNLLDSGPVAPSRLSLLFRQVAKEVQAKMASIRKDKGKSNNDQEIVLHVLQHFGIASSHN